MLLNWGDISQSPAKRNAPQTKEPPKYHSETRGQNISCPLQKNGNIPNESVPPQKSRSKRSRLTSCDLKANALRLGDGCQVDGITIESLCCLPSKLSDSNRALATDSHTRPPSPPPQLEEEQTNSNSSQTQPTKGWTTTFGDTGRSSEHPASDTQLTPSLGIFYISPPMVMDTLIPASSRAITSPPKMSLLLEVERIPAVIIRPRLILLTQTDCLNRNKLFNQQIQVHIQYLNCIVSTQDASSRKLKY